MSKAPYIIAAAAGGLLLPVQVAINALLRKSLSAPMQVTFVSYAVGAIASLSICIIARYPLPSAQNIGGTSWWMWCGGFLGTVYVWATIFSAPRIGAGLALAVTIAAQMIGAVLIDHYGLFGLQKLSISPMRSIGVLFVVLGVALIAFTKK